MGHWEMYSNEMGIWSTTWLLVAEYRSRARLGRTWRLASINGPRNNPTPTKSPSADKCCQSVRLFPSHGTDNELSMKDICFGRSSVGPLVATRRQKHLLGREFPKEHSLPMKWHRPLPMCPLFLPFGTWNKSDVFTSFRTPLENGSPIGTTVFGFALWQWQVLGWWSFAKEIDNLFYVRVFFVCFFGDSQRFSVVQRVYIGSFGRNSSIYESLKVPASARE